jgi:hypothetical protein
MIVSAPRTLVVNGIASLAVIGIALAVATVGPRLLPYALDSNTPTVTSIKDCLLFAERFEISDIERCTFRVENARGWILLAGDSHADSYSNAVIENANDFGFDVTAILGARCPLIRDAQAYGDIENCSEMNAELFDLIDSVKGPDLVVLAQSDLPPQTFETITELQAIGIPILYLRDFPRWRDAADRRGPNPCSGGLLNFACEQPRSVIEGFSAGVRNAEAELLTSFPDVLTFDPWPFICNEQACSPVIDGRLGYQDDDHLNAWGSAKLQPYVYEVLRQELGTT